METRALLLAVVLVACGAAKEPSPTAPVQSAALPSPSTPPTQPGKHEPIPPPRFTWPASHEVPVVERVLRDGNRAQTAYVVRTCPEKDGRLRVEHANFRFVSLNDIPASDPKLAPTIEQLAPLFAAIPAFIVDASGAVVDLEGLDAMLATLEKAFPAEKVATIRKTLKNEQARAIFNEAVYSRWRAWVENWLAYDPKLGPNVEITTAASQKHRLSFDGSAGGRARLSLRSNYTTEQMQAMLGSLVGALGVKDLDPKKLENAKAEYSVRVETDWPEIRPHWVTTEKRISVEVEGKTAERIETHEYRFDWSAAKPVTCPVPTRNAGAR